MLCIYQYIPVYTFIHSIYLYILLFIASHFHDVYIDGKEKAKMTGDRMKMLMITLPFMVRDLIAPGVSEYSSTYLAIACLSKYIPVYTRFNSSTQQSSPDPVCTACLKWLIPAMKLWKCSFNAWTGQSRIPLSDLPISDPACAYVPYIHTTYAPMYVVCM